MLLNYLTRGLVGVSIIFMSAQAVAQSCTPGLDCRISHVESNFRPTPPTQSVTLSQVSSRTLSGLNPGERLCEVKCPVKVHNPEGGAVKACYEICRPHSPIVSAATPFNGVGTGSTSSQNSDRYAMTPSMRAYGADASVYGSASNSDGLGLSAHGARHASMQFRAVNHASMQPRPGSRGSANYGVVNTPMAAPIYAGTAGQTRHYIQPHYYRVQPEVVHVRVLHPVIRVKTRPFVKAGLLAPQIPPCYTEPGFLNMSCR